MRSTSRSRRREGRHAAQPSAPPPSLKSDNSSPPESPAPSPRFSCDFAGAPRDAHQTQHRHDHPHTVLLDGHTADGIHQDKMGEYSLNEAVTVNQRPLFMQHGNPSRAMWYASGAWRLGRTTDIGEATGWLVSAQDEHDASLPTQVTSWSIGNSAGHHLKLSRHVRCVALEADDELFEVDIDSTSSLLSLGSQRLELRRVGGTLVSGKPLYAVSQPPMLKDNPVYQHDKSWRLLCPPGPAMTLADGTELRGAHAAYGVTVKRHTYASALEPANELVVGIEFADDAANSKRRQADRWTGVFRRLENKVNHDVAYARVPEGDVVLWPLSPNWYVGLAEDRGSGKGFVHTFSRAIRPEDICSDFACLSKFDDAIADTTTRGPPRKPSWLAYDMRKKTFLPIGHLLIETQTDGVDA